MKVLYDDCLDAIKNNKCSECNDYFQCSVCDYIEQRYQQGRADQKAEDNSFFNFDKVIEIECNKAVTDERDRIVKELEELHERYLNQYGIVGNHSLSAIMDAIEIARGGENE